LTLLVLSSILVAACGSSSGDGPGHGDSSARFELGSLVVTPAEAISGQEIAISVTVSNLGNLDGVYTAELTVNGHVVDSKDVSVPGGGSQVVTFSVSRTEPGTYDIAVGDRLGSFIVKHPPLNLELDYIGMKCVDPSSNTGKGSIRLLVLLDDGLQTDPQPVWVPLEAAPALSMTDYSAELVGNQLFHTGSVGNYFKVLFIAYRENTKPVAGFWEFIGTLVGGFYGQPQLGGTLGSIVDEVQAKGPEYTYVGSYQAKWTADQGWGIGRYDKVGEDDLRLWFRIWSDSEQEQAAAPTLLPDVAIQDVTVPALVGVGKDYSYDIVLRNNEAHSVTVALVENSSVHGEVFNEARILPANGSLSVSRVERFEPAGLRTMTYTVLKDGKQVCTVSKTVEAKERFAGWYVDGNVVTSATKGSTVIARLNLFDLAAGQYTMRIGRDIESAPDVTITEITFYYNGVPTTQDLSFVPPYATGELSTRGYWVDLWKDGSQVWVMIDPYPPRLRVYL
jgi:hypothetical protein